MDARVETFPYDLAEISIVGPCAWARRPDVARFDRLAPRDLALGQWQQIAQVRPAGQALRNLLDQKEVLRAR